MRSARTRQCRWLLPGTLIVAVLFAIILVVAPSAPALAQAATPEPAATPAPSTTEVEIETLTEEQLADLKERLNALKERMFKSKASLKQLLDQIRMGAVSLISFSVQHTNDVGATFELETVNYNLDGFDIYSAVNTETEDLDGMENFPVYEGSLLPGEHLLIVDLVLRGRGYGIFSYLNQYLFKVKGRYTFTVSEGDVLTLHVTSYDEGSFLTSLKDRLKVKFEKE